MTSILDLQGLNLGIVRQTDLIHFMKEFVKTMDAHFPQRSNKMLIVNAPKWFNVIYKIVSPLLRETTKAKIEIHANGKRQDKALHARLGDDSDKLLPESFFSKSKNNKKKKNKKGDSNDDEDEPPPPDHHVMSQLEKDLREFVSAERMFESDGCNLPSKTFQADPSSLLYPQTLARLDVAGVKMQEVVYV